MGIVALIPAKMTSKRLLKKNLLELCGRPLIYFSIRVAQLVEAIDDIYVSSESTELLGLAKAFGAQTLLRPQSLSRPEVKNIEVMRHFYRSLEEKPEIVVLLQPTHPLRHPDDLALAVRQFHNSEADVMFSLVKMDDLRGTVKDGLFMPEVPFPRKKISTQETFKNCGSFYLFRPEASFMTEQPFGHRIAPFVMEHPELEVDIDHARDIKLAECLLGINRERFGHFNI